MLASTEPVAVVPSLAQLRALVALADTEHFGAAASLLGVSQPAVSSAVRSLEKLVGVGLVQRTTRRVTLTAAGRAAASQARQALTSVARVAEVATAAAPLQRGRLRIGMIPTVAPYILAATLKIMGQMSPPLMPEVTEDRTSRLLDHLASGAVDVAVLALPAGIDRMTEIPLYREDFVLLVPPHHQLAGTVGVEPEALRSLGLLLLEEGHCLSDQALDLCRQVGASTDHPARAASLTTLAQLVAAGHGSTLLPATALPVETRKGRLAVARFAEPAPGRTVGLVFPAAGPWSNEYRALAEKLKRGLLRPGFAGRG
jgi:LysR family hydrogen peroxide-inducible transcriptional activator